MIATRHHSSLALYVVCSGHVTMCLIHIGYKEAHYITLLSDEHYVQ